MLVSCLNFCLILSGHICGALAVERRCNTTNSIWNLDVLPIRVLYKQNRLLNPLPPLSIFINKYFSTQNKCSMCLINFKIIKIYDETTTRKIIDLQTFKLTMIEKKKITKQICCFSAVKTTTTKNRYGLFLLIANLYLLLSDFSFLNFFFSWRFFKSKMVIIYFYKIDSIALRK